MKYIEMTVEEANRLCEKSAIVLVAITDLANDRVNAAFTKRKGIECDDLFEDAQTVFKHFDDFVKQLNVFTEKQDIHNIIHKGEQRTILIRK